MASTAIVLVETCPIRRLQSARTSFHLRSDLTGTPWKSRCRIPSVICLSQPESGTASFTCNTSPSSLPLAHDFLADSPLPSHQAFLRAVLLCLSSPDSSRPSSLPLIARFSAPFFFASHRPILRVLLLCLSSPDSPRGPSLPLIARFWCPIGKFPCKNVFQFVHMSCIVPVTSPFENWGAAHVKLITF